VELPTVRRLSIIAAVCALAAAPASASNMPVRKAGLWELTMTFEQPKLASHVLKQCTDAATDKYLNSRFGGSAQQTCAKQEIHQAGGVIIVNSVCTFAGMTTQSHAVITGSFDSAYRMDVTTMHLSGPQPPGLGPHGERRMSVSAKWLGPCKEGQRPGDIIMTGGIKMNVLDMRKAMQGTGAKQ
jgi:Protein of unknown function (DUF3617)